jgi:protein-disulfide isomerase
VIVEFSDFQCPYCRQFHEQTLPQIVQGYIETGKVRLGFRDFPIMQIHPYAGLAALAAECADDQGKFWGMHDLLFERQSEWAIPQARELFAAYARELGLDEEAFSECMTTEKHAEEIFQDLQDGVSYGVQGTPAFFINGEKLEGAWPFEKFQEVIDAALAQREQ